MEYVNVIEMRELTVEEGLKTFNNKVANTLLELFSNEDISHVALMSRDYFTFIHESKNPHNKSSSDVVPAANKEDIKYLFEYISEKYTIKTPSIVDTSIVTFYFKDGIFRLYFSNQLLVKRFKEDELGLLEADFQNEMAKVNAIPEKTHSFSYPDITLSQWLSSYEGEFAETLGAKILSPENRKIGFLSCFLLTWLNGSIENEKANSMDNFDLEFDKKREFFEQIFEEELQLDKKYLFDEFEVKIQLKDAFIEMEILKSIFITKH